MVMGGVCFGLRGSLWLAVPLYYIPVDARRVSCVYTTVVLRADVLLLSFTNLHVYTHPFPLHTHGCAF